MDQITIGILAGMGPRSTAPFIDLVVDECQKQYGATYDQDFPQMMIYSLPTPFYVDRPVDHDKMKRVVIAGLRRLESAGVDFIAIPCNVVHQYFAELKTSVHVPLLNMIEESIQYLHSSTGLVAIVGTESTVKSHIYQDALEKMNVSYVKDMDWQPQTNEIIKGIKSNAGRSVVEKQWQVLMQELENKNVVQVLLACSDLNVLPSGSTGQMKIVDTTKILAEATVKKYLELKSRKK